MMAVNKRFLVVDADENVFKRIKDTLTSTIGGYTIDYAPDAGKCLAFVKDTIPDILLVDIDLPEIDGFTLRKMLKETQAEKVPVIFMTARMDLEMTRKMGILTADDFITKPINLAELIIRTQKILVYAPYRRKARKP